MGFNDFPDSISFPFANIDEPEYDRSRRFVSMGSRALLAALVRAAKRFTNDSDLPRYRIAHLIFRENLPVYSFCILLDLPRGPNDIQQPPRVPP